MVITQGQEVQFCAGALFLQVGIVQEIKSVAHGMVSYKIKEQWYSDPDFMSFPQRKDYYQNQNQVPVSSSLALTGKTHLRSLVMRCQEILNQVINHPEYTALEYFPDLEIGDASYALIELMEALCQ